MVRRSTLSLIACARIGVLKGQERKGAASRLMALRAPRVNDREIRDFQDHLCRDVMPGQT